MAFGRENVGKNAGRSGDPLFNVVKAQLKRMPGSNICWKCGDKIDMTLHYNDPMAWTADHVQSLANGGNPYDLANLKPAHRSCNSKRGRALQNVRASRSW